MAKILDFEKNDKTIFNILNRAFQSSNINFLIGSGCSSDSIPVLGSIENTIQQLEDNEKYEEAERKVFSYLEPFLKTLQDTYQNNKHIQSTISNYKDFICNINQLLDKRKSNILPKRVTIFSTNYDLFIEKAFEYLDSNLILSDGFRRTPNLQNQFYFSTTEFNNTFSNTGNLYNYKIEIPVINLVKIHGSLNWRLKNEKICCDSDVLQESLQEYIDVKDKNTIKEIQVFNQKFSIVLPRKTKFKDTLINQTYYDLLRFFSNELEKENTIVLVIGFSFADEHIREITKRALKNPTLLFVIFCYTKGGDTSFESYFAEQNNVIIIYSSKENFSFNRFNCLIQKIISPDDF